MINHQFKDTLLYHGMSSTISGWLSRCWYFRIITLPALIIQIIIALFLGVIVDSFYFLDK
jgi:hypothetical protein